MTRSAHLARLLDSRFRIPGTSIRFGIDAIIGLAPGVGDTVAVLLGSYIIMEAVSLKVPRKVLLRMAANLGIDWLMGLLPLVGDVADVWYKANMRNARLLEEALKPGGSPGVAGRRPR